MTATTAAPVFAGKAAATSDPEIAQITNVDENERFYIRRRPDGTFDFRPSLTFVLGTCWPNQQGLINWIGEVGNDQAERIKTEAGEDGSYIHDACHRLLKGEWIACADIDRLFLPRRRFKIKQAIQGFCEWVTIVGLVPEELESVVWCDQPGYAGTMDFRGTLDATPVLPKKSESVGRKRWIVDWKSGKSIHEQAKAQVCAYAYAERQAGRPVDCVGLLHLANQTQRGYSFIDVTSDYDRFLAQALHCVKTFHLHSPDAAPSQETFPSVFVLPQYADQLTAPSVTTPAP